MVVESPCPVCTIVSSGNRSSVSRMLRRIVGSSLWLRPVAPGPPQNNVSPLNSTPEATSWKQQHPGE